MVQCNERWYLKKFRTPSGPDGKQMFQWMPNHQHMTAVSNN
jgi:hypothetical protein